jgi:lipopolysaccharide/colanic/teichoic acid biosynthesis glycosyltransferase
VVAHGRDELGGGWAVPHAREPWLKRPLDFLLASLGLLFSAPLWPLIALAIKKEDGGPVFYMQERWGRDARTIRVRKFRTMTPDADGRTRATVADPRVTRAGKLLRRMGLDELPQLLSIWRGDMSLVGPRALAVDETYTTSDGAVLHYDELPAFAERSSVRPGLTSPATIYLPKDADPRDKFAFDLRYVREQSVGLDLQLIALSIWISFRGRWEDRGNKL